MCQKLSWSGGNDLKRVEKQIYFIQSLKPYFQKIPHISYLIWAHSVRFLRIFLLMPDQISTRGRGLQGYLLFYPIVHVRETREKTASAAVWESQWILVWCWGLWPYCFPVVVVGYSQQTGRFSWATLECEEGTSLVSKTGVISILNWGSANLVLSKKKL